MHASKDFKFMEGKVLKKNQGITFDVLAADKDEKDAEHPKHVFVPEVVREPRMHYYQVPRLGSYLTIKLEYDSCLVEESFDYAIEDYNKVNELKAAQEEEIKEWERAQEELEQEKEQAGESFEREEKTWKEFSYAPFKTRKVQLVVCMNTLGQDRAFTEDEKLFALKAVKKYRDTWEVLERKNMEHDVLLQIKYNEDDRLYRDHWVGRDEEKLEELIEGEIARAEQQQAAEGEDPLTESEKEALTKKAKFDQLTRAFHAPEALASMGIKENDRLTTPGDTELSPKNLENRVASAISSSKVSQAEKKSIVSNDEPDLPDYDPLVPEQWLPRCREFQTFHLMKFPRIFQSLTYLLKFQDRAAICETDTNKLSWKKMKTFLSNPTPEEEDSFDLFSAMAQYTPFGAKDDEYTEYQKLNFIRNNIHGIEDEIVDDFSVALGKLYRWLQTALDMRIEDVESRRKQKTSEKEMREEALEREKER